MLPFYDREYRLPWYSPVCFEGIRTLVGCFLVKNYPKQTSMPVSFNHSDTKQSRCSANAGTNVLLLVIPFLLATKVATFTLPTELPPQNIEGFLCTKNFVERVGIEPTTIRYTPAQENIQLLKLRLQSEKLRLTTNCFAVRANQIGWVEATV